MTFRLVEDQIPELCAKAVAADGTDFPKVISELRAAMHEHIQNLRRTALQQFAGERRTAGDTTLAARAMQGDIRQRLRELTAKIAIEQDHDKFTVLVQEANQLLDGEEQQTNGAA